MLLELLTTSTFHTYRKDDRELLLDIRYGKYRNEDGTVKKEFNDLVDLLVNKCKEAEQVCKLKENADVLKINELVNHIYKEALKDGKL